MKTTIDTQQLAVFAAVVRHGGFTAAARALDTDKGYISRTVSRLEDQMGTTLLERSTRRVAPTRTGVDFYEKCVEILSILAEAEVSVRSKQEEPSGVLRVALAPEFGRHRANTWFAEMLEKFPRLSLDIRYTNRKPGKDDDLVDLEIRLGEIEDSTKIATRVGSVFYGLYATPEYLEAHPKISSPEDLRKHTLLLFQPLGVTESANPRSGPKLESRWRFERDNEVIELKALCRYRSNNIFATRQMCAAGFGVAILSTEVADLIEPPATERLGLTRILEDWSIESTPVNFLFFPAAKNDPRIRELIDIARRKLS